MSAAAEMPRYRCHKEVWALKIKNVWLQAAGPKPHTLEPEDKSFASIEIDDEFVNRHKPHGPGYYVVYADGYKSWSPVEAFESGYTLIPASLKDRVRAEHEELVARAGKLSAFITSPAFGDVDVAEQGRLRRQMIIMLDYRGALEERIAAFE